MHTANDAEIELPPRLLDVLASTPHALDRKDGAALVTAHLFPVSPATLKAWPLPWSAPNGKALAPAEAYLRYAYRKTLAAGPTTSRWRRATAQTAA